MSEPDGHPTADDASAGPPSVLRVVAVVPVILAVATLDDLGLLAERLFADRLQSAAATAAVATIFGLPAAFWALERGRQRARTFVAVGAIVAALLPLTLIATGFVGQMINSSQNHNRLVRGIRSPFAYAVWTLKRQVSLPLADSMTWPVFAVWTAHVLAVGALSGLAFWWLVARRRA